MTEQPQIADLIPGMTEALDAWLAEYDRLFISPTWSPPATEAERYARRMQEAGLLGTAYAVIWSIRTHVHDADRGLAPELRTPIPPIPAGQHHDGPPLPQRRAGRAGSGPAPVFTPRAGSDGADL